MQTEAWPQKSRASVTLKHLLIQVISVKDLPSLHLPWICSEDRWQPCDGLEGIWRRRVHTRRAEQPPSTHVCVNQSYLLRLRQTSAHKYCGVAKRSSAVSQCPDSPPHSDYVKQWNSSACSRILSCSRLENRTGKSIQRTIYFEKSHEWEVGMSLSGGSAAPASLIWWLCYLAAEGIKTTYLQIC